MLTMFANILTADSKHSLLNTENLTEPIQTELSKKQKIFCAIFFAFVKFILNFEHFHEKDDSHS